MLDWLSTRTFTPGIPGCNPKDLGSLMFSLNLKRKLLLSVGLALLCVTLLLSALAYRALHAQVIDGNYAHIDRLA